MPEIISFAKLSDMAIANLTDLTELLTKLEDVEPDPDLEDGQEYTSDGTIVTLYDRSIIVVNATHENFTEQVKSSAVVYITGGDTRKLLKELKQHPDFLKLLDGKTIAGSSAGANVFSSFYYSTALKTVCEGLGILPFLLVCHYENKEMGADESAVSKLKQHNSDFEVITLAEQEFKSLEIDLSN